MPCTTILVGKNASYDGSTLIARNEDSGPGDFTPKKFTVVHPENQPKVYKSVLSHVEIPLPSNPMRYTCMPDAIADKGIWGAAGVNSCNVAMTATETITSNARVLAADPLVEYIPAKGKKGTKDYVPEVVGGIGEEDIVTLVLPYIKSAKEGVLRLGSILEEYGTYEMNGIAFQDIDEIWWLETIGGHHWMAKRVKDDEYVVMPNQLGIDQFDFKDAYGKQKENLCSKDLEKFVKDNHLNLNLDKGFSARLAFGSHTDADHVYNTPRAWMMARYFNPSTTEQYHPEDDNIPWSFVPEHKITIEDVKYILSHHYQGTPYDPYGKHGDDSRRGSYRPIGVNRNNFLSCTQIRPYKDKEIQSIEWIAYGSNVFNAFVPFYVNINDTPEYLKNTSTIVTTENFYWANRIIGALADAHFSTTASPIDRYQYAVATKGHQLIQKYDALFNQKDVDAKTLCEKANQEIAEMLKQETDKVLNKVLFIASLEMKNGFSRADA